MPFAIVRLPAFHVALADPCTSIVPLLRSIVPPPKVSGREVVIAAGGLSVPPLSVIPPDELPRVLSLAESVPAETIVPPV